MAAELQGELLPTSGTFRTNSFPAETAIISPENSFALCAAPTLFESVQQVGFFKLLAPVCHNGGSFTTTFRLRIKSDYVWARSWLRSDVGEKALACCELLPAA